MAGAVSVVIPTYNRAEFILGAIDSVLEQTHRAHEIIIVDDGSTDETRRLVEGRRGTIPNLRVIETPGRQGAPKARNLGAELATGELLAFLDSDDIWQPRKLEAQLALLAREPGFVAAGSWYRKRDAAGELAADIRPRPAIRLADLVYYNEVGPSSVILVAKEAFHSVGGFDPAMVACQDWELFGRLAVRGAIGVVQEHLVVQEVGSGGRISADFDRVLLGHREVLRRMAALAGETQGRVRRRQGATLVELSLRFGAYRAAMAETVRAPSLRAAGKWARAALSGDRGRY